MLTENVLVESVMLHGPDILDRCAVDPLIIKKYVELVYQERLSYPVPVESVNSNNWFVPTRYKNMDIETYLIEHCPNQNHDRLVRELELYRKNKMIPMLQTMKYIVDSLRENHIVWGVGRGSSVASYALFLLGVHKIDSIEYDLPIEEFFKEI